ncbi:MAG: universal stress protein [Dehalococcoidales bacterium]|nr:MAG: universal stress protein [Dehalococcoidales bacterium]
MKIMLALDGSEYSEMSVKMLKALRLPSTTEVTIMTVVPEITFLGGITLDSLIAKGSNRDKARKEQDNKASTMLKEPVETLRGNGLKVETLVCRGRPEEQIMKKASETKADLVVIGAKGTNNSPRFPLGSIAHKVMKYAPCSVMLVKEGPRYLRRVFFATDGSKYSDRVTRFLLELPLPKQSQVTIVSALESHLATLMKMPTLDLETNRQILAELQETEEKAARELMNKTRKSFEEKGYKSSLWVLRGGPAESIISAANELNPELIALGAKGLTGIEALMLGSVAQRVARFSRHSVLIVRPPKR